MRDNISISYRRQLCPKQLLSAQHSAEMLEKALSQLIKNKSPGEKSPRPCRRAESELKR
jgi:hypothetical protein